MGQNVYPVDLPLEWGLPEHGIFDSGPETGLGGDSGDFNSQRMEQVIVPSQQERS